jgi:hypothetical protein
MVEAPLGRGRMNFFGFRSHRHVQTYATFKFVFNSLWYAAAERVRLGKVGVPEE